MRNSPETVIRGLVDKIVAYDPWIIRRTPSIGGKDIHIFLEPGAVKVGIYRGRPGSNAYCGHIGQDIKQMGRSNSYRGVYATRITPCDLETVAHVALSRNIQDDGIGKERSRD